MGKKVDGWDIAGRLIGAIVKFLFQVWLLTIWWGWFALDIFHLKPLNYLQSGGIILTVSLLGEVARPSQWSTDDK